MKITVIYGTERKGSTYHIAQQFLNKLEPDKENITEFFLPGDAPNFCRGCFQCFSNSEKCPDYEYIKPILTKMEEADCLVFTSPVYVYHVTGQMKAFLDHFGFQWMAHQPNKTMFHKQALIISTAAGAGTRSTIKDIRDSMLYWGVARTYRYGKTVAAADWSGVKDKTRKQIQRDVQKLAAKIKRDGGHITPCWRVKALFYAMRQMHKSLAINKPDVDYWAAHGWLGSGRPW